MRRAALVLVAASGMLLAACSSTATSGQGDGAGERPADAPSTSPAPDATVAADLDFTAAAVDGSTVRGADYAGDALAIWFWAPW